MRLAIKNTNMVLNLAISPGLILIPSDITILKKKVAGYNKTSTLVTKDMKFGVNEEVNKVTLPSGFVGENLKGRDSQPFGKNPIETTAISPTQGVGDLTIPSVIPGADGNCVPTGHHGHLRFRGG